MQLMTTTAHPRSLAPRPPADRRLADARRVFLRHDVTTAPVDAARDFSSTYLMKLATSLPLADVTAIIAAEEVRESGLVAVRKGMMVEAGDLFARAEAIASAPEVSIHAQIASASFQLPAEAYLAYRTGDLQGAINRLLAAIRLCCRLEREFGHDMGFRCLHLVRNVIRTYSYSVPAQVTLDQVLTLLRAAADPCAEWTLVIPVTWRTPVALTDAQRAALMDEALMNLAIPEVDLRACEGPSIGPADTHPDLVAGLHWIRALIALRRGNDADFSRHAARFLEMDRPRLAHAARLLLGAVDDQLGSRSARADA
ncbi:hypothetical protein [Sphingomonas sp. CCH18-H6]|uniref:hypothetical protein n=2 Tax=unclassified Sphingomonas TaxID=196159 RepID=UPI000AF818B8|nr:hypothetical protein [Sphingomonas sp. CCH18-H6]